VDIYCPEICIIFGYVSKVQLIPSTTLSQWKCQWNKEPATFSELQHSHSSFSNVSTEFSRLLIFPTHHWLPRWWILFPGNFFDLCIRVPSWCLQKTCRDVRYIVNIWVPNTNIHCKALHSTPSTLSSLLHDLSFWQLLPSLVTKGNSHLVKNVDIRRVTIM
jgi:hypothetical protein